MLKVTKVKCVSSVGVICLLAACGGGSVSNQEFVDSVIDRAEQIDTDFIEGQNALPLSELPRVGPATYSGVSYAVGGIGNPDEDTEELRILFLGNLELSVDLNEDTITGVADNFVEIENVADLDLDDEEFADPVAGGDVSGQLDITGDLSSDAIASFDVSVTGSLEAESGANLNFGAVEGSATVFGSDAEVIDLFAGTLVNDFDNQDGFIGVFGVAQK